MPLKIATIESLEALEDLQPQWWALWEQDAAATPFQSPDWLLPWGRRCFFGVTAAIPK